MGEFRGRHFRLHYVEEDHRQRSGRGREVPVVFAHGFVMDHGMFAAQFEELPDTRRCVAWDMRGHGFSAAPHGRWTMQDFVDDLVAFVEGVHAAPCHLVGHAIGGTIALRAALQRPDLVRSLVLISTSADAENPERAALYRGFQETVDAQGVDDELIAGTLPLFYADAYIGSSPEALGVHTKRVKEMPREAVVETLRALLERESIVPRLGGITVPALVIHGAQDRAVDPAQATAIVDNVPGAELVLVEYAGHTPPLEEPDEVNAAIGRFLADLE